MIGKKEALILKRIKENKRVVQLKINGPAPKDQIPVQIHSALLPLLTKNQGVVGVHILGHNQVTVPKSPQILVLPAEVQEIEGNPAENLPTKNLRIEDRENEVRGTENFPIENRPIEVREEEAPPTGSIAIENRPTEGRGSEVPVTGNIPIKNRPIMVRGGETPPTGNMAIENRPIEVRGGEAPPTGNILTADFLIKNLRIGVDPDHITAQTKDSDVKNLKLSRMSQKNPGGFQNRLL